MDVKMEVYAPDLEMIGILEVFRTALWEECAYQAGSFTVTSILSAETMELLAPDNIIWFYGDVAGIIEHIEQSADDDGVNITAKGFLLSGLLERRILWGKYDKSGSPNFIMRYLVTECCITPTRGTTAARVIPNLIIDPDDQDTGTSIRTQKTGGSLLEILGDIGASAQTAFGIRFDAGTVLMKFYTHTGVDRSIHQQINEPVFFSTELDDVLASDYSFDSSDLRNVSLVAGEGEGTSRVYVTVNDTPEGISRRELFVDARDLQSEDEEGNPISAADYQAILSQRGLERLSEHQLVKNFSTTVKIVDPTYEYGTDYFLGDTITVTDERIGITMDAVVEAVERSVSREGEGMTLTLGHGQPTVYDLISRKA